MILRSLSYSGDSARVPLDPALLALPGFTLFARVGLKDTSDLLRELATLSPMNFVTVFLVETITIQYIGKQQLELIYTLSGNGGIISIYTLSVWRRQTPI